MLCLCAYIVHACPVRLGEGPFSKSLTVPRGLPMHIDAGTGNCLDVHQAQLFTTLNGRWEGKHVRCMARCGFTLVGDQLVAWCMQVQRTCEALVSHGFIGLRTFESILRYYEVQATHHLITDLDAIKDGAGGKQRGRQSGNKRPRDATGGDVADAADVPAAAPVPKQTLTVAKPNMDARGHTGYLTVARKAVQPASIGEADRTQDD